MRFYRLTEGKLAIITSPSKSVLLNLDGPLLSDNEGQNHEDGTGHKKKRKRRKKKKNRPKSIDQE